MTGSDQKRNVCFVQLSRPSTTIEWERATCLLAAWAWQESHVLNGTIGGERGQDSTTVGTSSTCKFLYP